jgi:hypothetical protein
MKIIENTLSYYFYISFYYIQYRYFGSALDPHSMVAWIRIRISIADPVPEDIETAIKKKSRQKADITDTVCKKEPIQNHPVGIKMCTGTGKCFFIFNL